MKKIDKTWIILGVAVLFGALAAWGARSYLSSEIAAVEARSTGAQVAVVVAKVQLQKGDVLSPDTVAIRNVPVDLAHSGALLPSQLDAFDGKVLAFGANSGEMILWSMLEGQKVPTFSARIETGHRAITVPVDEINSISGLLEPGDLIDLLVTTTQKDKKLTFPLLQSVSVMATGQRSVDDPKSGERRQYSTVTLDATPEQAQSVIEARETGKITALLRNPTDKGELHAAYKGLPMAEVHPGDARSPADLVSGLRQVPVLYGGQAATLTADALQMGKSAQAVTGQPSLPVPGPTGNQP